MLMTKEWIVPGIVFGILFIAGFAYLLWLDSGCGISGMMTWAGKVCMN